MERISAGGAGVARKVLQFARMRLTEIKMEVKLNAAQKAVRAAAKAADVLAKLAASKEGMVQAKRAKRASMTRASPLGHGNGLLRSASTLGSGWNCSQTPTS